MPRLSFLHSDKFLPVQSELGMLSLLLACAGLSRMDVLASFSREFIRVSPFRVSRGQFVLLRGKLCSSSHVGFHALLCDVTTLDVLDFFRWLVPRRASSGPARVGGRSCESGKCSFEEFQRVQRFRERARTQRVVLNCPGLDIAHRRLVQSERRYGAEPRLHGCSCKALSCDEK